MRRLSRAACVAILVYILLIAVSWSSAQPSPAETGPEVIVETVELEVKTAALQKLGISSPAPGAEVTVSVAKLLWLLADPNNSKLLTSTNIKVQSGKTARVSIGKRLKYLVRTGADSFTEKLTDEAIGTTVEVLPSVDRWGDITIDFKCENFTIEPPKEIDPKTSLPIGPPVTSSTTVNRQLRLRTGETVIAGGTNKGGFQRFVLVRAEIPGDIVFETKAELLETPGISVLSAGSFIKEAAFNNVLKLWDSGDRKGAAEKFLLVKWDDSSVFSGTPILTLSEEEYLALPASEQNQKRQEGTQIAKTIKILVRYASRIARASFTAKEYETAEEQYDAIRQCGLALSGSESLSIFKMTGRSIQRSALKELIKLYARTDKQENLKSARESLSKL